jgi:lysozyme family protein
MIQRTLGVKVDGIMGTKSMAALEAKQISLGFTDKETLTELEESKLLQLMQGIKKCLLRLWQKKPYTTDRSMDPIRIARPEQSRQDETGERAYRKAQRA